RVRRQAVRGAGPDSRRARLLGTGDRAGRLAQRDPAVVVPAPRAGVRGAAGLAALPAAVAGRRRGAGGGGGGGAVAMAGLDHVAVVGADLAAGGGGRRRRAGLRLGAVAAGHPPARPAALTDLGLLRRSYTFQIRATRIPRGARFSATARPHIEIP